MATLRFFAGIYETFSPAQASHFLVHVLTPLHRILDENGDLPPSEAGDKIGESNSPSIRTILKVCLDVDELRNLALEVREFVQAKVGTSEFSRTWEGVRRRVTEKREVRRDARNRMVCENKCSRGCH
jgi:U3 small nucleolar RNA-associated protein 20